MANMGRASNDKTFLVRFEKGVWTPGRYSSQNPCFVLIAVYISTCQHKNMLQLLTWSHCEQLFAQPYA